MYLNIDSGKLRDVVAFGRATIDLYANEIGPMEDAVTFHKYVGGSPANTAVAMSRLGLSVGYIGKVSDDQFGRFITRYLAKQGVDVSHIALAGPGIRSGVTMGEILDESYLASHKLLLISGTSLSHSPAREAVFHAISLARRNHVAVAFDLDYREDTWDTVEEASLYLFLAAEKADLVLGTRDEFDVMEHLLHTGNQDDAKSAAWLLEKGVSVVSIKKGKKGSHVFTKEGKTVGGIYPAQVLKTFGAGDSYSSAFLFGLLHNMELKDSLRYAAAASSITISGHSCSDSMPTLEQVEDYIAHHEYVLPDTP